MGMKVKPVCFCLKSGVLNALIIQLSHTGCSLFVYVSLLSGEDLVSNGGRVAVRNSPLNVTPASSWP